MTPVNYVFTDEQTELRRVVRKFLVTHSGQAERRRAADSQGTYDPQLWQRICSELDLPALGIPAKFGGAGYGATELSIAFEEMGAALCCSPFFATIAVAANALVSSTDTPSRDLLLTAIASGDTATLAHVDGASTDDSTAATRRGESWILRGRKQFVLDGTTAKHILVTAQTNGGRSLFAVRGDATGLVSQPMSTLDLSRPQALVTFHDVEASLVGTQGRADDVLARTLDLARVALAAEQVGGAQHCLDSVVDYAKVRHQFGRPIGSFQAVKHKCADIYVMVEQARTACYHAARVADHDAAELATVAPLAGAFCSEAFSFAATEAIQVYGGIGYTWEHDAHLYFRRAKSAEVLLGTPAQQRELLLQRLGH